MTDGIESRRTARLIVLLLAVVVAAGFALRTWNINFDRGIGSHPDERSTACFYATRLALPVSWAQFRDPHQSPLNPLWDVERQERRGFTYGHFPLYLGTAMGELWARLAPAAGRLGVDDGMVALMARAGDACDAIAVAGRFTIALLDTLTILLIFLLGRRIYGQWTGLLAATLYAFAAQAIQLSHFFAMDPASTTFTVWTILGGVMMVQSRRLGAAVLTGIMAGLAISSKFSALPILAVPMVAAFMVFWQVGQTRRQGSLDDDAGRREFNAVFGAALALLLALLAFALTSPYSVLDWRNFVQATLVEQGRMVRGVADFPFTRQYRNTTPYLYFIRQQVQWGLGWPLGIVTLLGVAVAAIALLRSLFAFAATGMALLFGRERWRAVPDVRLAEVVIWSWVVPYFGLTGAFLAKFNRYMIPLLPFAMLFAAALVWRLWQWGTGPSGETVRSPAAARGARIAAGTLATVAVAGGIFWSLAYVNGVYGREHTWITASRWIYANAPAGSVILWELWDDPLPKAIPGEPGLDMGSAGLRNIDWSPYEEDTAEKYAVMRQKLREADFVAYSSKRIYDSVDELPERYPMTNLYYQAMWDGRLGFEQATEVTAPPALLGWSFDDRQADESWSLYDHPQVTIFRKVRELSDADYDALFAGTWDKAVPWYRGADSPLSPLLTALGLGSSSESESVGLLSRVVALATGQEIRDPAADARPSLALAAPLDALPVVDDYRWNRLASENTMVAIVWWWAVVALLGWLAWPYTFALFRPLRDRGYFASRTVGWLLGGWLLWWLASIPLLNYTVDNAWLSVVLVGLGGLFLAFRQRRAMGGFVRANWPMLLLGEGLLAAAYLCFITVRMGNPDLWQPWFGGEKFMEFAFLNGILRSPTFPPVDPHFAGGYINYYYFGIYLVSYLIKLTGIYAEVAFNLAIPMIFGLTVVNAYAVAYSAQRLWWHGTRPLRWQQGAMAALLAPFFVALIGNLDGFAQLVRSFGQRASIGFSSTLPAVEPLVLAADGLGRSLGAGQGLPIYDFWGPSRVIPYTINEFPFWSFLYADLHPHLIGMPFALLFLLLVLTLLADHSVDWRRARGHAVALVGTFALLLGTLASVNLWEFPTYVGLGMLTLLVSQYRGRGRINWPITIGLSGAYVLGAYVTFLPFFRHYHSVAAGGVGLVRAGDAVGPWLLIWGLFFFILASWLIYAVSRPVIPRSGAKPTGVERALSMAFRRFDRLPRVIYLHQRLVARSTFAYRWGIWLLPLALLGAVGLAVLGRSVLALCLPWLALATLLLWRRSRTADEGALFTALLAATGFAVLAGTQVIYLKDFLQGGDWYRMNTLFKFFSQIWVIWGVAAAMALPRVWTGFVARRSQAGAGPAPMRRGRLAWASITVALIAVSLSYPLFGTPARLEQRFPGWRPAFGTLNGLDFMVQGAYSWPDDSNQIELKYDWEAIQWLLDHMRGNPVVVESSEVDYYRAGGSRVASLTGLSGLRGMHASEQRWGEEVGARDALHREFWSTPDLERTQQLIDELGISLVYVGQLERRQHPDGVLKLEQMAARGQLAIVYTNPQVTIYAVPGALVQNDEGIYVPS